MFFPLPESREFVGEFTLFHDADGCLNLIGGQPLPFCAKRLTKPELSRLQELGRRVDASPVSHFILNTGRSWATTSFLCDAIGSSKLCYALVEHGSELWNVHSGSSVNLFDIACSSRIKELPEALASKFYVNEMIKWFSKVGAKELCRGFGYSGPLKIEEDKSWNLTFSVPNEIDDKVMFEQFRMLVERQPIFSETMFTFHHSRWNRSIDLMGAMDKGLGMAVVMEILGIDISQTVAIGDGLNDISMLERAGTPICPANAEADVIALCRSKGVASSFGYIEATINWLAEIQ